MTRLLFILLASLATTAFAEIPFEEKPAPIIFMEKDPLAIHPNAHPKDTLRFYLNNLTNYIYNTDVRPGVDPRAAFFNQEHQLRIYETLNHYVEENYGTTLREILGNEYLLRNDDLIENESKEKLKNFLIGMIIDFEDRVSEMFLGVIYTSGDKAVEQERLQEVQEKKRSLVNTFAQFATSEQLIRAYERLLEIHDPVLNNFKNTVWESRRVKRTLLDDEQLKKVLNDYLRKFTAYGYGISEFEFLSAKIDLAVQPPGSLISLKRFIEANYREFLKKDIEIRDGDIQEKIKEIEEIKQIEEKTTALWFEVVNYANLDLLKNQTIVDDINAAIVARLDEYMQFRSLEEIKETNRRIHEVYGHLFKDCDQSTYLNLLKIFKEHNLAELYPNPSRGFNVSDMIYVERATRNAESIWQPRHGMSKNELKRVNILISSLTVEGVRVLIDKLSVYFEYFFLEGPRTRGDRWEIIFNDTDSSQRIMWTNVVKSSHEGVLNQIFNETEALLNIVKGSTTELPPTPSE